MGFFQHISGYYRRWRLKLQARAENSAFGDRSALTRPNTLLLLRLDSIGDYVLFRNFIATLKASAKYRNYKITLCGNSWWKELAETLDAAHIDAFIWVDYGRMQEPAYRRQVFGQIHGLGFELLVHPTYSRDSIADSLVMHSGAARKIGYRGDTASPERDAAYTQLIASPARCEFEYFRNHYFFELLLQEPIALKRPAIHRPEKTESTIIVCPGAKAAFRRWAPARFAELCDRLQADYPDAEFAICGSAQDGALAAEISAQSKISFVNYCGSLNLIQLLDAFAGARLIITNDSGPFHLAVALNKQVVCLSNGNNYGRFTPYPEALHTRSTVVYPAALLNMASEAERLEKFCREGSPLDINSIGVAEVYRAIQQSEA